jgi:hypothetical protein
MMTRSEQREAAALLKRLIARADAEPKDRFKATFSSPIAKAQKPYVTRDNLGGMLVYPAPLGGWHADLILNKTPPGVLNSFGTPVTDPPKTKEEAMKIAYGLVQIALAIAAENEAAPSEAPADPAFILCDEIVFPLLPELLSRMAAAAPPPNEVRALRRLEEVLIQCFGKHDPTFEEVDMLDHERRAHLLSVIYIAALHGILRYPEPTPAVL